MTQITIERTRSGRIPDTHPRFFMAESPIPPAKPAAHEVCPHCQSAMNTPPKTAFKRLPAALGQLLTAILIIVFSVFRLARLAVGIVLCFVGVIGFGLQTAGAKIVHPADRRLLPGIDRQTPN